MIALKSRGASGIVLLAIFLVISGNVYGTEFDLLPLQTFDDYTGWTIESNGTATTGWVQSADVPPPTDCGFDAEFIGDTAPYFYICSAAEPTANFDEYLISPAFSTEGMLGGSIYIDVAFNSMGGTGGHSYNEIMISTDASNWVSLETDYFSNSGSRTIEIPGDYMEESEVFIAIHYSALDGNYSVIDNVHVVGTDEDLIAPDIRNSGTPWSIYAGDDLPVSTTIMDPSGIATATLHYMEVDAMTLEPVVDGITGTLDLVETNNGVFDAVIPGDLGWTESSKIAWYVTAVDASSNANEARFPNTENSYVYCTLMLYCPEVSCNYNSPYFFIGDTGRFSMTVTSDNVVTDVTLNYYYWDAENGIALPDVLSGNVTMTETEGVWSCEIPDDPNFEAGMQIAVRVEANIDRDPSGSGYYPGESSYTIVSILDQPLLTDYFDDFEMIEQVWESDESELWEHGSPSYPDPEGIYPSCAVSGTNLWATNLDGDHILGENAYLTTTQSWLLNQDAKVYYSHWMKSPGAYNLQISCNDGASWEVVEPICGYSTPEHPALGEAGFMGSDEIWETVGFDLSDYYGQTVKFQYHFACGTELWLRPAYGVAIDDFILYNVADGALPTGTLSCCVVNPDGSGIENVSVIDSRFNSVLGETDANGDLNVSDVLVNRYTLKLQKEGYYEEIIDDVDIVENETTDLGDLTLLYPETEFDQIDLTMNFEVDYFDTLAAEIQISNVGTGDLTYSVSLDITEAEAGSELDEIFDEIASLNLTEIIGPAYLNSAVVTQDGIVVTSEGLTMGLLILLDFDGTLLNTTQVVDPVVSELAYDPVNNKVYGATYGGSLVRFSPSFDDIEDLGPVMGAQAMAYDYTNGLLYIRSFGPNLVVLNIEENTAIQTSPVPAMYISGLGYVPADADGNTIWAVDPGGFMSDPQLLKYNPDSDIWVIEEEFPFDFELEALECTTHWPTGGLNFAAMAYDFDTDEQHLKIIEGYTLQQWLLLDEGDCAIPVGEDENLRLTINPSNDENFTPVIGDSYNAVVNVSGPVWGSQNINVAINFVEHIPGGNIIGTISDCDGTGIEGVFVSDASTGDSLATTDETGAFSSIVLTPGTYTIRMEHPGYFLAVSEAINVEDGVSTQYDATLLYPDGVVSNDTLNLTYDLFTNTCTSEEFDLVSVGTGDLNWNSNIEITFSSLQNFIEDEETLLNELQYIPVVDDVEGDEYRGLAVNNEGLYTVSGIDFDQLCHFSIDGEFLGATHLGLSVMNDFCYDPVEDQFLTVTAFDNYLVAFSQDGESIDTLGNTSTSMGLALDYVNRNLYSCAIAPGGNRYFNVYGLETGRVTELTPPCDYVFGTVMYMPCDPNGFTIWAVTSGYADEPQGAVYRYNPETEDWSNLVINFPNNHVHYNGMVATKQIRGNFMDIVALTVTDDGFSLDYSAGLMDYGIIQIDPEEGNLDPDATVTINVTGNPTLNTDYTPVAGDRIGARIFLDGECWNGEWVDVIVDVITTNSVNDVAELPGKYELHQNYPNPFNPVTEIKFDLVKPQQVKLSVFNILGQQVATLVDNRMDAGFHSVSFNASMLSSGMYFYRIETPEFTSMKKLTLLK